jgi:hypothetical protein
MITVQLSFIKNKNVLYVSIFIIHSEKKVTYTDIVKEVVEQGIDVPIVIIA